MLLLSLDCIVFPDTSPGGQTPHPKGVQPLVAGIVAGLAQPGQVGTAVVQHEPAAQVAEPFVGIQVVEAEPFVGIQVEAEPFAGTQVEVGPFAGTQVAEAEPCVVEVEPCAAVDAAEDAIPVEGAMPAEAVVFVAEEFGQASVFRPHRGTQHQPEYYRRLPCHDDTEDTSLAPDFVATPPEKW